MSNDSFNTLINFLHNNPDSAEFALTREFLLELIVQYQGTRLASPRVSPPEPPPVRTFRGRVETEESKTATEAWRLSNSKKQ